MNSENLHAEGEQKSRVFKVTPLSKYLAMALFIILPFIGGWIGYTYAPVKIVKIEVPIEVGTDVEVEVPIEVGTDSEIVSKDTGYLSDEALLTFVVDLETTSTCRGFDQVDYTCVRFEDSKSVHSTKVGVVRIEDIDGFEYDAAYRFVITVERLRSDYYGALDAKQYDYTLKEVVSKEMI